MSDWSGLLAHPPHARRAVAALVLERNELALGGEPASRVLRVRVRGRVSVWVRVIVRVRVRAQGGEPASRVLLTAVHRNGGRVRAQGSRRCSGRR